MPLLTTIALTLAAPVPPPTEVTVEVRGTFPEGVTPLALSPAGDHFLAHGERCEKTDGGLDVSPCLLTDAAGQPVRKLGRASWLADGRLSKVDRPFAVDGRRVLVSAGTGRGDANYRVQDLRTGATEGPLLPADGAVLGAGFAGRKVVFVDNPAPVANDGTGGFRVRVWDGRRTATAHTSDTGLAEGLAVSPDGATAATFVYTRPVGNDTSEYRLLVVDLATGRAATSDPLPLPYRGGPRWAADKAGVAYEAWAETGKRQRTGLVRVDVGPLKPYWVGPADAPAVWLLDRDHAVVSLGDAPTSPQEVVRVADGNRFPVPPRWHIRWRGGPGKLGVVTDRRNGTHHPAIIRLPGEKAAK